MTPLGSAEGTDIIRQRRLDTPRLTSMLSPLFYFILQIDFVLMSPVLLSDKRTKMKLHTEIGGNI